MSIDSLGRLVWTPKPANLGQTYAVTISVTDAQGATTTQTFALTIAQDTQAPQVSVFATQSQIEKGSTVTLVARATDNIQVAGLTLVVDGQPVTLDANGRATVTLTQVKQVSAIATARDLAGNQAQATTTVRVIDSTVPFNPNLTFNLPDVVTAPTRFNVAGAGVVGYKLEVAPVAGGTWRTLAEKQGGISPNEQATFDPSLLENDSYTARLTLYGANGDAIAIEDTVGVAGDLKLGNFRLSFTDLSIPVTGIPITLTRTYDTLTSGTTDDFGYGWRMEFRDTDLRTSLGKRSPEEELLGTNPAFNDRTKVYITLPGGNRESFSFKAKPVEKIDGVSLGLFTKYFYEARFESENGNTNQLSLESKSYFTRTADGSYSGFQGQPFNPADALFGGVYVLTSKDGTVYRIDAQTGDLLTIKDPNGNTLTYTDAAITSSTGQQVTFERDAQNRITSVKDPMGASVRYEYNAQGDLVSVTDRENNTTRMVYDATYDDPNIPGTDDGGRDRRDHFLREIIDPLGRAGARTEYDENGRLKQMVDAAGQPVGIAYDPANSVETVTNQLGYKTTYEYDQRGNIVTEVDAVGKVTKRKYNDNNNVLEETVITTESGPTGWTTKYTYDGSGNQLSRTNALGQTDFYTYNSLGKLLTSTDPLGHITQYTYDKRGNVLSKTDAKGYKITFNYDFFGNLLSVTEDANDVTRFEYDQFGNRVQETDALGNIKKFNYDQNGNTLQQITKLTTSTGTRTLITTKAYDATGHVTSFLNAEGNLTQFAFGPNGNQTSIIDALNRQTAYQYNERNQLLETIYPDNTPTNTVDNLRTTSEYDVVGNRLVFVDTLGRSNSFKYDQLNRITEVTYPDATPDNPLDNSRIINEYNQLGQLTATVNERGVRTEYKYDVLGRVVTVRTLHNGQISEEKAVYDQAGRKIATTDTLNRTTRYVYDELDQLTETIYADGARAKTTYDSFGNVVTKMDQQGLITSYEYDVLDQLIAVVDAKNQHTEYRYDEAGNLISQKDTDSQITRYEYDGNGRQTAIILPLGQRREIAYDKAGNISQTIGFDGRYTTYEYDQLNQLRVKHFIDDGHSSSVIYSSSGKPEQFIDDRGITSYQYDERDRLLSRTEPDGMRISYTYNQKGRIETVKTAAGATRYVYDDYGYLDIVSDASGSTDYDYDKFGNIIRIKFANGVVEEHGYDSLNRLTFVSNRAPDGSVLSAFTYTFDEVGQRKNVTELGGRKVEYTYNELYQLVRESITDHANGDHTISYTYDRIGNRLTRDDSVQGLTTYIYDDNDRLISETAGVTTTYIYDDNGNLVSERNPNRQATYEWNSDNRLIGASITDSTGVHNIQYRYNANGIRVASIIDGQETRYLIDTNHYYPQVIAEYKPTGEISTVYTYGSRLLSQTHSGQSSFYLYDGHSGVRQLSDESGHITDSYTYEAYGSLINSIGSTRNSYLYQGEQFDANLGLQYLRARYYDPSQGRFTSVDPLEGIVNEPMSRHRYIYGNNNPVAYGDPTGEFAFAMFASDSAWNALYNAATIASQVALNSRVLAIASGLAGAAAAITAAVIGYSAWRSRTKKEVSWQGTFDLTKIPVLNAPTGTPSLGIGRANLGSPNLESPVDRATVGALGASFTLYDGFPNTKLPSSSTYNVSLWTPDLGDVTGNPQATSRGAFSGPFIFSTLRFTWPYIMPDNVWTDVDEVSGALALGFGTGWASKSTNLRTSYVDWEKFDAFEAGFIIGASVPIS